jgi:uncharacterized protein DUF4242
MPLYMDVHYRVDGLTAEAVAKAHAADLAVQTRHKVRFLNYWFDEGTGRVFCLSEAPNVDAPEQCHRAAHGLLADEITQVSEYAGDNLAAAPDAGLCMDTHFRVEGLAPEAIAQAIRQHTSVGRRRGVRWLKAWYDASSGRLFCLSESPTAAAHVAVHQEAAGLLVDEVNEVRQGM